MSALVEYLVPIALAAALVSVVAVGFAVRSREPEVRAAPAEAASPLTVDAAIIRDAIREGLMPLRETLPAEGIHSHARISLDPTVGDLLQERFSSLEGTLHELRGDVHRGSDRLEAALVHSGERMAAMSARRIDDNAETLDRLVRSIIVSNERVAGLVETLVSEVRAARERVPGRAMNAKTGSLMTMLQMSQYLAQSARLEEAAELGRHALSQAETLTDASERFNLMAAALNNLGTIYARMGHPEDAVKVTSLAMNLYQQALEEER